MKIMLDGIYTIPHLKHAQLHVLRLYVWRLFLCFPSVNLPAIRSGITEGHLAREEKMRGVNKWKIR